MSQIRQERKSCETCRARKLRCSGDKSGCSRCKSLSLPCKFKDKGAPGRPRKRLIQEYPGVNTSRRERTTSSSSSHFSSMAPDTALISPEAINMFVENSEPDSLTTGLAENCGFDTLPREMMGTSNVCSFPLELWQTSRQSELDMHTPDMQLALEPYTSAVSPSQTRPCKCDEDVSNIVRSLNGANMGHDVILTIRTGVSLSERLLTCPICYDVSKPPRLTVQNVLLIGHLMLEVTSSYRKYIHWLDKNTTQAGDDARNDTETVYLDSGLGFPSELNLQISSEKLRDLVMDGLQMDVQRLLRMGERFAERQRHRHTVGHTTCPDAEGRCRRREYGIDHDPLDVCPHNPVARKLIPCFRIVDEVREMIQQVADTLN